MVGLVGLPKLRDVLLQSHPSALRLFDTIELGPLSDVEAGRVIDRCLEKSNEDVDEEITISCV